VQSTCLAYRRRQIADGRASDGETSSRHQGKPWKSVVYGFRIVSSRREVVSRRPRAAAGSRPRSMPKLMARSWAPSCSASSGRTRAANRWGSTRRSMWPLASHTSTRAAGRARSTSPRGLPRARSRQREQWCGDPGQDDFGDLAQLLGRRRQQRRYARRSGRDRRAVCSRVRAGVNTREAGIRCRARSPVAGLPGRACAATIPRQPR
jgi:hypothetical protein